MAFYPVLGNIVFWLGLIAAVITYLIFRKWHPVIYIISGCIYIFTVGFTIEVFQLKKEEIMGVLAISAAIMVLVGVYLSNQIKDF